MTLELRGRTCVIPKMRSDVKFRGAVSLSFIQDRNR